MKISLSVPLGLKPATMDVLRQASMIVRKVCQPAARSDRVELAALSFKLGETPPYIDFTHKIEIKKELPMPRTLDNGLTIHLLDNVLMRGQEVTLRIHLDDSRVIVAINKKSGLLSMKDMFGPFSLSEAGRQMPAMPLISKGKQLIPVSSFLRDQIGWILRHESKDAFVRSLTQGLPGNDNEGFQFVFMEEPHPDFGQVHEAIEDVVQRINWLAGSSSCS